MSTRFSFVTSSLSTKSFSCGALVDLIGDKPRQGLSTSDLRDQSTSLTSYEDVDEEEMVTLTEKPPPISQMDQQASTASTPSFQGEPGGISQSISTITPLDATDLESNKIKSIDGEINAETQKQATVVTGKAQPIVFSTRDKVNIAMFAAVYFCSTVVCSCIAPFFPEVAKEKGASEAVTGLVFGIFELIIFLTAPVFGRYITTIGSKFMYETGLCVMGVTTILFGLLNLVPAGTKFIVLAFVTRIIEALGNAAVVTAAFAIVANAYSSRVATIIGILETFGGLGFAAGPPIGSALYEAGGFYLPFAVLGGFLIVAGLISFPILPKRVDLPTKSTGSTGIFSLLRMQAVWTMLFAVLVAAASFAFLDPTLQPHLIDFNLSPLVVGLMFLIMGGTYAGSAPVWGYLIDQKDCARQVILFGCASTFISLIFIGPSPIFPFKKRLWLIAGSQIFMGVGVGALFIPPYQQCVIAARLGGYPDNLETYGLIAGLFRSSASFGAFLGPTIGGFGVELMGFAWTASAIALLHLISATLIILLILMDKRRLPKNPQAFIPTSEALSSSASAFATHHERKSVSLVPVS